MDEVTLPPRRRRRVRRKHRVLRTFTAIVSMLVVIAVIVAAVGWWLLSRPQVDVEVGVPVELEIASGLSSAEIGAQLAEAGVVTNANMFRLQLRLQNAGSDLKAGVYEFQTRMSYDDVIERLSLGPEITYFSVTIPEGFVLEQIAERMEAQAGIPATEFLALARPNGQSQFPERPYLAQTYQGSLEGYLFPKTYRIREGSTAREVIEMMLAQFEQEIATVDLTPAENRGMTMHQVVTLASMIEREAKVADERVLVSSVIYNRLDIGMRLEIDATIEYVLPGNRFRLNSNDLKVDTPYNTYMYEGLPPGPIANPGLEALKAAVNPADTEYLYYVLTSQDGSHTFASTYEEFQQAKQLSKEVFGQ